MKSLSKSRKVNGYVKAMQRYRKLRTKLDAKMATLNPLEEQVELANNEARARYAALTGGQLAEAERILRAES